MTYAVMDLVAAVLSLIGSLFCLTAAAGLVRFPDLVSRMHPAAKPQSLGMVILMVGLALHIRTVAAALFLALVTILQMMTVTLASHVVARAGYRSGLVDPATLVTDELAEAIDERRRAGEQRAADERAAVRRSADRRAVLRDGEAVPGQAQRAVHAPDGPEGRQGS